IGRLAILKVTPEVYTEVLEQEEQAYASPFSDTVPSLVEMERATLGVDHVEIGTRILEKWCLPEITREAIRRHHASSAELQALGSAEVDEMIRAVAVSSAVADYFTHPQ